MLVILGLTLSLIGANAYPHIGLEHDEPSECNAPLAIKATARCWAISEPGGWLLSPDNLNLKGAILGFDWESYMEMDLPMDMLLKLILGDIVDASGGHMDLETGIALLASDALDGDNGVSVREHICSAIWELMRCSQLNAGSCAERWDVALLQAVKSKFLSDHDLFHEEDIQPKIKETLDSQICFLCKNNGEALEVLFQTMLNQSKVQIAEQFNVDTKREEIYTACDVDDPAKPDLVTLEYLQGIALEQPCLVAQYIKCLADEVHNSVNPDKLNVVGGLIDITRAHVFDCPLDEPLNLENCAVPPPAYEDSECNPVTSLENFAQCFGQAYGGEWLLNTHLEVGHCVENANWQDFLVHLLYEERLEEGLRHVLHENYESAAVGLLLLLDDAAYESENGPHVRKMLCRAFRDFKTCAAMFLRQCTSRLDEGAAEYLSTRFALQSRGLPEGGEINSLSISHVLDEQACYLCSNNGEPLKLVLQTMLDPSRQSILESYKDESKRLETYSNCEFEDPNRPLPVTVEYMLSISQNEDYCLAHKYGVCLADAVHNEANPSSPNEAKVLVNIAFHSIFGCEAPIPESVTECDISPINTGECQPVERVQELARCWMDSDGGSALVERLEIAPSLENADWRQFFSYIALRNDPIEALNLLFNNIGGSETIGFFVVDLFLQAVDDNDAGDMILLGLEDLLKCSDVMESCVSVMNLMIKDDLFLFTEGKYYELPNELKVESLVKTVNQILCYFKNNYDAANLVYATFAFEMDRLMEFVSVEKRLEIYNQCNQDGLNIIEGTVTKQNMIELAFEDVCEIYPLVNCYAEKVHNELAADSNVSPIGDITDLIFAEHFHCENVASPIASYQCPALFD